MKKVISKYALQYGNTGCGVACSAVQNHFNLNYTESSLKQFNDFVALKLKLHKCNPCCHIVIRMPRGTQNKHFKKNPMSLFLRNSNFDPV